MSLQEDVNNGVFIRATDEEIVEEEKLLLEHLECISYFVSDHINNLLQEVEGQLPGDKEKMLAVIGHFQALKPEDRTNYIIGRRIGMYRGLNDMNDIRRREVVDQAVSRLGSNGEAVDEKAVFKLMEGMI
jgi:hypothetical protein